jgi:hypothetical protein
MGSIHAARLSRTTSTVLSPSCDIVFAGCFLTSSYDGGQVSRAGQGSDKS